MSLDSSSIQTIQAIAMVVGPLVGAGAGSYFGLRGALNGLRERSARMETTLTDIRDHSRDVVSALRVHDGRVEDHVARVIDEVRRER